jgi:hypothetical protein
LADEKENGVNSHQHRVFVPYDKGADLIEEGDDIILPNYYAPIQFYVEWSPKAVRAIRTNKNARVQGAQHYFTDALTYSFLGYYSPTFRLGNGGVFDVGGSPVNSNFYRDKQTLLAVLASKFLRFVFRSFLNHSVNLQVEEVNAAPLVKLPPATEKQLAELVAQIVAKQKRDVAYDYASNEQLKIDRLVYEAYGLNEADIREVEDWYARRYPKLAQAQRRALAAKQGKTEEQLLARPVLHLYCDESRHLPYDREPCLLMSLLSAPAEAARELNHGLSNLLKMHGLPLHFEAKWTKVSPAKLDFYKALVEWFFAQESLSFRATILPDKQKLYAALPEDSRDHLYYRLYYQLLRSTVEPENRYRAFLDLKDTRGREKLTELRCILADDADDESAIQSLQHIHSHEVRLAQMNDLLLGAVGFARRPRTEQDSPAKLALVELIGQKAGFPLAEDSPPGAQKLILATWHDKEALLL